MCCLRVALLFLLISSTLGSPKPYYDLEGAEQHFTEFIKKYEKHYESVEEYNKRFQIFKDGLKKINHLNAIHEASFDLHQYADEDMSNFGCYNSAGMNISDFGRILEVEQEWIQNAPFSLDWRAQGVVSRVKNQGNCKNCYVFAAVGNIESRHAMQTRTLLTLSEQQATDCAGSCLVGGLPHEVMDKVKQNLPGLVREVDYPYLGIVEQCVSYSNKPMVSVTGRQIISTPTNEALMAALAQYGPLAVGIYMSPTLQFFRGDVAVTPNDCPVGQLPNHAVLLVGYATDRVGQTHWIIKNSYGTSYGNSGYLLLAMTRTKICSLAYQGAAVALVN